MAIPVRLFIPDVLEAFAVALAATFVLGAANVKIWERLNPQSVLRLYADRRKRLPSATGDAPAKQKLLPAVRADDPEDAELPRVLELLGARVDGDGK
jgi:hypothetical protein